MQVREGGGHANGRQTFFPSDVFCGGALVFDLANQAFHADGFK
jgi:hypothetical protein